MKKWNTPDIKELNISATMQHGKPSVFVDGAIYDPLRDENWYTFSGHEVDKTQPEGDVVIHNPENP